MKLLRAFTLLAGLAAAAVLSPVAGATDAHPVAGATDTHPVASATDTHKDTKDAKARSKDAKNKDKDKDKDKAEAQPLKTTTLPVTTSSPEAARYFEQGMVNYENHRWNLALNDWRDAIKVDPQFALAHTWICLTTTDPAEESTNREQAKTSMSKVTPAEQLMVRWMVGTHEDNYMDGISAMNDLLALYPEDKRLNFLLGYWLYKQDQYDLAQKLTLNALATDAKYATAYNQIAYIYSRRGDFTKALDAAQKYVALLPDQPNPHDSYGEMLRLSGHFDDALTHYRMALKIDPTFYISQKELGETYALMGDEERARTEYAKAVQDAPGNGIKAEYQQKAAMTYVRDRQYDLADKAFLDAAQQAETMRQWIWEARAYRIMAMYEPDVNLAMQHLGYAESILIAATGLISQSDLDEEKARILRVRVERQTSLAAAQSALSELEKMAGSGGSVSIQRTYHGAAGTLLVAQDNFTEGIEHLEEDFANPLSMKVLLLAYEKSGATEDANNLRKRLAIWRIPSIEEAIVVPPMHTSEGAVVSEK